MAVSPSRETNPNSQSSKTPQNSQISPHTDDQEKPDHESQSKTPQKSPNEPLNLRNPAASPASPSSIARSTSRVVATDDDDEDGWGSGSGKGARVFVGGVDSAEETGIVERGLDWNVGEEIDEWRKRRIDDSGVENAEVSKVGSDGNVRDKGNPWFSRSARKKDNEPCLVELKDECKENDEKEPNNVSMDIVDSDFVPNLGISRNVMDEDEGTWENDLGSGKRRYSREEKGKGILVGDSEPLIGD